MGDALLFAEKIGERQVNARNLGRRTHATALLLAIAMTVSVACGKTQSRSESKSPAPAGARFTPNLTWDEMLKLPKIWGVSWASTREWDDQVVHIDRMTLIPPLKPAYLAASEAFVRRAQEGKAEFKAGACYPNGVPRSIWYSYPPSFLFRPGNTLLITSFGETREVFMDGRGHPQKLDRNDPAIAYLGHSVGWWEGDTLVIDTVGFAPEHELYYDVPNGGNMHVIERYRLSDPQTLALTLTVEDPDKLEKPWVITRNYLGAEGASNTTIRARSSRIETWRCRPGFDREVLDESGNAHVNLKPPPKGLGIGNSGN